MPSYFAAAVGWNTLNAVFLGPNNQRFTGPVASLRASTAFSKKLLQVWYVLPDTRPITIDSVALDLPRDLRPNEFCGK